MSKQHGLRAKARPIQRRHINVGTALRASTDLDMAYQTQSVGFLEKISSKSYCFPKFTTSPWLSTVWHTSVNAFDTFTTSDDKLYASWTATFEIPWVAHPNATVLMAQAIVFIESYDGIFELALETATMNSAGPTISTVQGPEVVVNVDTDVPACGRWHYYKHNTNFLPENGRTGVVNLMVQPDYPEDRKLPFVIRFKGQWNIEAGVSYEAYAKRVARIMSVRIWDEVRNPNPAV